MQKILLAAVFYLATGAAMAAVNSELFYGSVISARETGGVVIQFRNISNGVALVPAQGCTNDDRAVIVDTTTPGGKAMFDLLLSARGYYVSIRVDGCVPFNPEQPMLTAPRIIRLQSGA